ncbi:MAG: ATP-binding protein [Candidatus Woesearchaeota archaeon]|nr:ATP-binding protein [Candidatus Woesearchaeota archaeon]
MSAIPYYQARELIETGIAEYVKQFEGAELPQVKIEKKGEETSVGFGLSKDADMYKVVNALVTTISPMIGKMSVWESLENLFFSYKNGRIFIDTHFGNSVTLSKEGDLTSQEIDAVLQAYRIGNSVKERRSPRQRLLELGVTIYDSNDGFSWDYIAGYEDVKQEIRDTVLLPLQHPEVYERIAKGTRKKYETVRPKAVLFEGPPGTGKTTSARIIAGESESPMIYVPVESIMTKWYGESERNLAGVFDACSDLVNSLIFLDEIDSLATSREKDLYEATRRVLSVLLRKIDGFEPNDKTILIGATNRKQDLDPALISRFDVSIYFHLPNLEERVGIFRNYAKQLSDADLEMLARESEGISGRNIKDVCEHSERRWASKLLRGDESGELPPPENYLFSLKTRKKNRI